MAARITDEQKEYILASPESAQKVAEKIDVTEGHVRYIRRLNGYEIQHKGHGRAFKYGKPVDISGFNMPIPDPRIVKKSENKKEIVSNWLYG